MSTKGQVYWEEVPARDIEDFCCKQEAFPKGCSPYIEWLTATIEKLRRQSKRRSRYRRWVANNREQRRKTQRGRR